MSRIAPTYVEFITLYPAFASLVEPAVQGALDFSARLLSVAGWGDFYSDAVGLDAAHNLTLESLLAGGNPSSGFKGAVGPISSVSGAGISTSFANIENIAGGQTDAWYSKTYYGQKFLRLRSSIFPSAILSI